MQGSARRPGCRDCVGRGHVHHLAAQRRRYARGSILTDSNRSGHVSQSGSETSTLRARILLVVLCLGWGTTWVTMRIALTEIPPFSMRVTSLALGALVLTAFARLQRRNLILASRRARVHVCIASLFNIVAFSVLTPFAQLAAETSRVAILVYTMPIWATLLALPVLGERLTATRTVALALCMVGMGILIAPLATRSVPTGVLLALGAAFGWAAGTVYLKWARIEGDPLAVTIWQLVVGLAIIAACLPVFEGSLHLNVHWGPLVAVVYSGVIGSGLSYFLWFDIVRRLPATTASLGVLSAPVIGVVSAMIVLGERPTLPDAIGFALMLSASAIVLLRPDRAVRGA
jgi:drug/metabolite transporter (DMT)-like permease